MTHRLTTDYAKNYCNWALIVKVIVENVVTCFLLGHRVESPIGDCNFLRYIHRSVILITSQTDGISITISHVAFVNEIKEECGSAIKMQRLK